MTSLSYSPELVTLARAASLAFHLRAADADSKMQSYVDQLRDESAVYAKALLPHYFHASNDPLAEEGYIAASMAHAAFIHNLDLPEAVIEAFAIAAHAECACTDSQLDALIAAGDNHVVWWNRGIQNGAPEYGVITFPASFPAEAIEVWWPLLRACEASVLSHTDDGSYQHHCRECHGLEVWRFSGKVPPATTHSVRLLRGTMLASGA